jgi:uncharacterized repeat protein (TIGR03803 family)
VIGSGGVLYGTTYSCCVSFANQGTAFSLTPPATAGGTWTHATIQEFTGDNGVFVEGGLVIGSGGVLYGTTHNGGTNGANTGLAFSLTPPASPGGAWTENALYNFGNNNYGFEPKAGMVIGNGGVLYGTASENPTVFALVPPASPGGAWTDHNVHIFKGYPSDGAVPYGGVVIGKNGVLYGTTENGGNNCPNPGCGTVFSVTPSSTTGGAWTETVLYNFYNFTGDGANPEAGVVIDDSGVLYGTTFAGGAYNEGTVFSLTPPSSPGGAWTETILHNFTGGTDGSKPLASVVIGRHGVLYGTTGAGGTDTDGVVFSLEPPSSPGGSWTETVLHSFTGADGNGPVAPVVIGSGGVLYGTTEYGGTNTGCGGGPSGGCGTVFSLTP